MGLETMLLVEVRKVESWIFLFDKKLIKEVNLLKVEIISQLIT